MKRRENLAILGQLPLAAGMVLAAVDKPGETPPFWKSRLSDVEATVGTRLTHPQTGREYVKVADPRDVKAGVPVERQRHLWQSAGQSGHIGSPALKRLLEG